MQKNPYIGPRTFQKDEGHLFFGREREARDLIALVASERLVIFYAQSGAGKSSIVNTRLIPNLETKEYEVLPVGRVSGDTAEGLNVDNIYIYNLLRSLDQHGKYPAALAKLSLSQFLAHLNYNDKGFFYDSAPVEALPEGDDVAIARRAVVIDQFEELFSTHPEAWEKRDDFFKQLAQAMQDDPQLWIVLVMREDYIAALDPYAHHAANGLRVRYYMQRLGREAGLKAVKSPVEGIRPYAEGVAEKLIDDLCSIKVQRPDGTLDVQPGQYVEPVQMQVVCYGLWDNLSPDGTQITEQDLQDVGDVNQSLGKYYDKRVGEVAKAKNVRERLIREWFERKLITAGGIRNMVLQEREYKPGELADGVIQALQSDLVRSEKRGGATWYELTHDRLVEPILERNKIWFSENLSPLQRQAALWKDQGQHESWLLRDQALVEVEEWAGAHKDELTDTEEEFLEACRKLQVQIEERHAAERQQLEMANKLANEQTRSAQIARRSAKRARQGNVVAGILIVIAVIATVFSIRAARAADDAAEQSAKDTEIALGAKKEADLQSNIARSGELSTLALERSNSQLDLAILLSVQADKFKSTSQSRKAMLTLLQKSNRYKGVIKTEDAIQQVQYSPDGTIFASRDKNGVTFWDAETLKPLNDEPVNGHFSGVTALKMSKDGSLIASGASDGTIVLWNADNREMLGKPFKAYTGSVSNLAFSPDGMVLVSASYVESSIILWDISDPAKPLRIGQTLSKHNGAVISMDISPDGNILASGGGDAKIFLWDLETREIIGKPLEGHSEGIYGMAFSPDGRTLAAGSYDDTVILWDVSDPEKPERKGDALKGRNPVDIESIAMSPNGKMVASGDDLGNIILWDVDTGEAMGEPLNGKTSWVTSLAFSPDGKTLAAGSFSDGKLILWDVNKRAQIGQTILDHKNSVRGLAFSPDGTKMFSASEDSTILFWDVSKINSPRKISEPLKGHPGEPTWISFSPDGSLLASDGYDGTILLDVKKREQIGIGSILTSPDGKILAYQTLDKTSGERSIHLQSAETNEPIGEAIPGRDPFFSPDGRIMVYQTLGEISGQTLLNLWDIDKARNIGKDIVGFNPFFVPDGQMLVYQTTDPDTGLYFVNVWDVASARKIVDAVEGSYLNMTPDGRALLYQTSDLDTGQSFVNVWDIAAAKKTGEAIEGSYLTMTPDGQTLIYQTTDPDTGQSLISFFDIATTKKVGRSLEGYFSAVSSDGRTLVYQATDPETGYTTINLWDTVKGISLWDKPILGSVWRTDSKGDVLLYTSSDENGQFTHALNLSTRMEIPIPVNNGYFNNYVELDSTIVYDAYNYSTGKFSIGLINTLTMSVQNINGSMNVQNNINGISPNLSPDGKYLIYGPEDGSGSKINLWSISQSNQVAGPLTGTYIGMFKDDKILVYSSVDGDVNHVNLFDTTKNTRLGEPINGTFLGISPDGGTLVTRNENDSVILWDVDRTWPFGEPITEVKDTVTSAAISRDGKTLAFADSNGITLQAVSDERFVDTLPNPHFGTINSVSFYQDTNVLLTSGEDGKTIAWDLNTYQPISDPITGGYAFFSPTKRYAVVIDWASNASTVWDLTDRQAVAESFAGQSVIFSPDEKYLAVSDSVGNVTIVWDLTKGQAVGKPFTGQGVVFSPNEKYMAVSDGTGNATVVWDLTSQQAVTDAFDGQGVAFHPDEKFVAIGNSFAGTVMIWDLSARKMSGTPLAGQYSVFSPDGSVLAVSDGTVNKTTLWDLVTQSVIGEPIAGQAVTFGRGGQTLAISIYDYTSSSNTTVVLFDLDGRKGMGSPFPGTILIDWTTNDLLAIVDTTRNTTVLWDPQTQEPASQTIRGSDSSFTQTEINILVVHDNVNGTTSIWDPSTLKQIGGTLSGYYTPVFSPDGTLISVADDKINTTTILDLKTGEQVGESITGYFYPTFCADNRTLGWSDFTDNTLNYWDLEQGQSVGRYELNADNISYYGYPPVLFNSRCDTTAIVEAGQNKVTLWDLVKMQPISDEPFDGASVYFSSDGSKVAIGDYNQNVATVWDLADMTQAVEEIPGAYFTADPNNPDIVSVQQYDQITGVSSYTVWDLKSVTKIGDVSYGYYPTFMSDGTLVVYGKEGVSLWDVEGDKPKMLDQPLQGHSALITAMMFSPQGDILATQSSGGVVLMDLSRDTNIHLGLGDYSAQTLVSMAFSSDGRSLTALGNNGTILIWDLGTGSSEIAEPRLIDSPYASAYRSVLSPDGKYLVYDLAGYIYVEEIESEVLAGDPIKVENCCGGGIAFTPDGKSMFYNDGGSIIKLDDWNDPAKRAAHKVSLGQNTFASLNVVMDPASPDSPKYLLVSYLDSTGNTITQIWDWEKNSRVGDPFYGNIQLYGSNVESHVLVYRDGDGRLVKFDLAPDTWKDLLCERAGRNFTQDEWAFGVPYPEEQKDATCPQWSLDK